MDRSTLPAFLAPLTIAAIAATAPIAACGGAGTTGRPAASLASTRHAAAEFAQIRDRWSSDPKARIALQPLLVDFVARFPTDGLTPLARAYLAITLLDMGDLTACAVELSRLGAQPPGATGDLVTIAHAELERRRGHPDLAFEHLRPLVGKVVDATARAILQEEVSLAAIEARRDYEAIAYMDAWLRTASEEDRDAIRAKVTAALEKEPEAALENTLRAMRAGGAASGYGREIQRLVTERLAALALARGDSELARWLVSGDQGAPLLGVDEGALGELATTKRGLASVDGRTIGLVLPTGSSDLRDEAAAVIRGVGWALELPRAEPARGDQTKLATRDDGGDIGRVDPTLSELAGEGAAVILAALDPLSAGRAVKWGEAHGVAVIVLAAPGAPELATEGGAPDAGGGEGMRPGEWTFVAGLPRSAEIAALGEELVSRGAVKIVPIVPPAGSEAIAGLARGTVQLAPPVACDTAAAQSGEARFPLEDWKRDRVHAWLVDAPSECARDLLHELAARSFDGTAALTLDAAGTSARAVTVRTLAVKAGEIPVVATQPAGVPDAEVRAWYEREGAPPNWWAALGHDAAVLARRAVAGLPLDATTDAAEVAKRRAAARAALEGARAHLWTSAAQGFTSHAIARDLEVVELPRVEVTR